MGEPARPVEQMAAAPVKGALERVCPTCFGRYPADFNVCPKDATKLENASGDRNEDPLLGAVLGSTYKVERVLGEGGMGRVYEASHLRLSSRRFAVKVLHAEYARNNDVLSRFQREAEAAASIAHPHVLEVFDVARTDDGRPYIVGELLQGQDFHEYLDKVRRLDVPTAIAISRQIASALQAAHDKGIVHRDLKPENVFIVRGLGAPFAKILDFGISKVEGKDTALTRTGMIMGTPNYMAPEQARGEKVDARIDVYALGAMMYRMLTGKRAFDGTDATQIMTAVMTEEPKRPRALAPDLPEAIEVLVQRAMAKDPADRYQSMRELDRELALFEAPAEHGKGPVVTIAPTDAGAPADQHAHTFFGGATPAPPATAVVSPRGGGEAETKGRDAKLARPTLVVLTPLTAVWALVVLVAGVIGLIRAAAGREATDTEVLLVVIFAGVAAIMPLVAFVAHVVRKVWPSSVKALEMARDLRWLLAGSMAAYGAGALAVRFAYGVPSHHMKEVASGIWDLAFLVLAVLGGAVFGGLGPLGRLRRRLLNA